MTLLVFPLSVELTQISTIVINDYKTNRPAAILIMSQRENRRWSVGFVFSYRVRSAAGKGRLNRGGKTRHNTKQ